MPEMSLVEGIRTIVHDQARTHGFARVIVLRLEIGRFAGVEKSALEFAFDIVMRGSPAEGARLGMIDLPGQAMCCDCMKPVEITDRFDPCPLFGGGRLIPQGGDEMRIKGMEVLKMCTVCGCSDTVTADGKPISHDEAHRLGLAHSHAPAFQPKPVALPVPHVLGPGPDHSLGHDHHLYGTGAAGVSVPGLSQARLIRVEASILAKNDALAASNRRVLAALGVLR